MGQDSIVIKGAREHNLKNVDIAIPRDKLVVITGLSGSGKRSGWCGNVYRTYLYILGYLHRERHP